MSRKKLELPYTLEPISDQEKAERAKAYPGPRSLMVDMVRSNPGQVLLTAKFAKIAEDIYNFEVRPDDVWMITYPKAGSTWTQEMLWQITRGLDLEGGQEKIFFRSPFLEMTMLCGEVAAVPSHDSKDPMDRMAAFLADTVSFTAKLPRDKPRIIKTHLPLFMLPPGLIDKCRVVVVGRNPKDSAVSWFHHEKLLPVHGLDLSFEDFIDMYIKGNVLYGHYWRHLKEYWAVKDHPNVLFLWYEEMKLNLESVIKRVASFLKVDFPDDKVEKLLDHLSFEKFKANDSVNMKPPKGAVPDEVRDNFNFIRKGKVGGWADDFSEKSLKEFEAWIELNNTNIPIKFSQ